MFEGLQQLYALVLNSPIPDWPLALSIGIALYIVGVGAVSGFSVTTEFYDGYAGSNIMHLAAVTVAMALFWPIWLLPLLVLAGAHKAILKIRRQVR